MINREIENLIAKYLTGEANSQEKSEFKLWLNSNDQNKEEFRQIALTFQLSKSQSVTDRKSQVFSKIKQRIDADFEKSMPTDRKKKYTLAKRWISIAATVLVIALVGISYFASTNMNKLDEEHASIVIKSNPAGQKSKVFLPDGSIVWLNSESSISYESEFKDSSRLIHLTGEAYFEVKKDSIRPFVVYSGSISTTALGTAFNINAFNENNITVSLTTGKVNVETTNPQDENKGLIINAGEGVIFNPSSKNTIERIVIDPDKVKMWRNGLLLLNNATLDQTIVELERWYGVDIILKNKPLHPWNANGLFDNEYLENVLSSLSFSQDFEYEINGKQIYVTFKQNMPM